MSTVALSSKVKAIGRPAPPLKWAGGKRWLVPRLLKVWQKGHQHRRLVEPFAGGLAVTLGLAPHNALLNDRNAHLISFYKTLQTGFDLESTGVTMENSSEAYYRNRVLFNRLVLEGEGRSQKAAALFFYLNRTGYNGLCRFNSNGVFNVPFGKYKRIDYKELAAGLLSYQAAFRLYRFSDHDFEEIALLDNDFVYADPPYDTPFTSYSPGGFTWDDQERLAEWLARHTGPVVVSNQWTSRVRKLYEGFGFKLKRLSAPRRISCDGNRKDAYEMLATRNL